MNKQNAIDTAKFYREVVVMVTDWRGDVEYYSSKRGNARKGNFIGDGYGGEIEIIADYTTEYKQGELP